MSAAAREAILRRLHSARAAVRLPRADAAAAPRQQPVPIDECVARFQIEASALKVECFVEPSPAAVRDRVAALTDGLRVLAWDPEQLPYALGEPLQQALRATAPREALAAADAGVTGVDAAIAETGSVVVLSVPGRSRAVSLLPPFHIAVVKRDQICFSMGEFFAAHATRLQNAASCTFITGPSRTADIELTLTLGIHGPGRVAIVIGP